MWEHKGQTVEEPCVCDHEDLKPDEFIPLWHVSGHFIINICQPIKNSEGMLHLTMLYTNRYIGKPLERGYLLC